ncbi:MAG: Panacea domain-containing protein [Chloroflexota bacterium]|nr:Panacea domain-containing protein [Chloroflexota bacterium]
MTTTMPDRPHPHLQRLVDYIVQKLSDHEGTAARTRLAKLLYLFDIEYYRVHGHPFTHLQWRFLHYGPYDTALEPYLGSDEATTTSGHRAYVARGSYEDVSVDDILTLSDRMILDRVVEQWGLEDSPVLFDYVYFGTEPMENVIRGEVLDFSRVAKATPKYPEPQRESHHLSDEVLANLRRRLTRRREARRARTRPARAPRDAVYEEGMRFLNAEDQVPRARRLLDGRAVQVTPEAAETIREQAE